MKRSGPRRLQGSPLKGGGAARPRTRFAVDAMHGSLARKLRALGFDAYYYKTGEDRGMMEIASRDGRVILTSDRLLVARAASQHLRAILLTARSDGPRLREVSSGAARLGIGLERGDALCSLCGGELESLRRADVAGLVPLSVERRHRLFYRCSTCGQVYWHGGHWKKLRSLARHLSEK